MDMRSQLVVNSYLMSRLALMNKLAKDPSGRDLDKECGYPVGDMPSSFYWDLYESVGIANRVVNVFPEECWSVYPELTESDEVDKVTPFEEKWAEVNKDNVLWSALNTADELSGIGPFGVMFLGFADGLNPLMPVPGVGNDGNPQEGIRADNKLMFTRVFDSSQVVVSKYNADLRNPRYGQPEEYKISIVNPAAATAQSALPGVGTPQQSIVTTHLDVHWSRVIHLADNRKSSPIFGMPRMKPVLPEIMDIRKIRGGSAEMFWRGAFPGYSVETNPDLGTEVELDKETVQEEFAKYAAGLQRYLALIGVQVKSLAPQISPPGNHLDEQYRSIGATIGVPQRILIGAESAHLASTQDTGTWNRRLAKRQEMYLTPHVIKPLVDRLIMTGVLPRPETYKVSWIDLNTMTAGEKADVALKQTQSLMTYVTGGVEQIVPLLEFFINVLGIPDEKAKAILKAARRKNRRFYTMEADPESTQNQPDVTNTPGPSGPPSGNNRETQPNATLPRKVGSPGTKGDGTPKT